MIDVNLTAPILLTKALLPALRRSGTERGSILLNVSSGIALVGMPFYSIYAATKSGLAQFGESLRRELTGTGAHVATVYPGATETAMMTSQNAGDELGSGRPRDKAVVCRDPATRSRPSQSSSSGPVPSSMGQR